MCYYPPNYTHFNNCYFSRFQLGHHPLYVAMTSQYSSPATQARFSTQKNRNSSRFFCPVPSGCLQLRKPHQHTVFFFSFVLGHGDLCMQFGNKLKAAIHLSTEYILQEEVPTTCLKQHRWLQSFAANLQRLQAPLVWVNEFEKSKVNISYEILLKKQTILCKLHWAIRLTLRYNLSTF